MHSFTFPSLRSLLPHRDHPEVRTAAALKKPTAAAKEVNKSVLQMEKRGLQVLAVDGGPVEAAALRCGLTQEAGPRFEDTLAYRANVGCAWLVIVAGCVGSALPFVEAWEDLEGKNKHRRRINIEEKGKGRRSCLIENRM